MTTTNYLHPHNNGSADPAVYEPGLLVNVQARLAMPVNQLPSLPTTLPALPPTLDASGDLFCGTFDDDLPTSASAAFHLGDSSPVFGATDLAPFSYPPLPFLPSDDIPTLPEMTAPAVCVSDPMAPSTSTVQPLPVNPLDLFGPVSSQLSPTDSSFTCSPFLSPFESQAVSINDLGISPLRNSAFDSTSSSVSSTTSVWPSLSTQPSQHFLPAPDLDSQLQHLMDGLQTATPAPESETLARRTSQAGKARKARRPSHSGQTLRFSPIAPDAIDGRHRGQSVASTSSSALVSPKAESLSRRGSVNRRPRVTRTFQLDPAQYVEKNTEHVFAVHAKTKTRSKVKGKGDTAESPVTRLYLDESTLDPLSPLGRAILRKEPYCPASFRLDCTLGTVYTFYTADRNAFTVTFALSGPSVCSPDVGDTTCYTFLHFLPGDLAVSPSEVLGSVPWWRLQECRNSHAGYPGDGGWTARFDGANEAAKRRPTRIYNHFAKCHAKGCEGTGDWSLMKLAKLMKAK
ncbi:hypothetical protein JCM11641_003781 [Rhodosporidiobolus odoratus]